MAQRPRRPRSHAIEDLSRAAFVEQMSPWVVRHLDKDYGFDEHVEVFEDDEATGLAFYAQVRATDRDLPAALAVRFRSQQLDYFADAGLPVLIVRYHVPSRRFFAKWFHRVGLHPAKKTVTIRLTEADELVAASLEQLADELRAIRRYTSSDPAWPIVVGISVSSEWAFGAREFVTFCRRTAGEQRYVEFQAETSRLPEVRLLDKRAEVDFRLASVTIHDVPLDASPDRLAGDVVTAIAVVLGNLGHCDAATRLVLSSGETAPLLDDPETLLRVAGFFFRAHRVREAIEFSEALTNQGREATGHFFLAPVALAHAQSLRPVEIDAVTEHLRTRASQAEAAGDGGAGAAYYSLGNWLFSAAKEYPEALTAFQNAIRLEPLYAQRAYYLHERAAAHFECGEYEEAVDWYSRAIARGSLDRTVACWADALIHAGRYGEAQQALDEYFTQEESPEAVWTLKAMTLPALVGAADGVSQTRNPSQASCLVERARSSAVSAERAKLLAQALAHDALCGEAWWLCGTDAVNDHRDYQAGLLPLLMAALQGGSPATWAEVLGVALLAEAPDVAALAVGAAYEVHRGALLEAVADVFASWPAAGREAVLSFVEGIVAELDLQHREGFTLRFQDDDGTMDEIKVSHLPLAPD